MKSIVGFFHTIAPVVMFVFLCVHWILFHLEQLGDGDDCVSFIVILCEIHLVYKKVLFFASDILSWQV